MSPIAKRIPIALPGWRVRQLFGMALGAGGGMGVVVVEPEVDNE